MSDHVIRVLQEDWPPFYNAPHALKRFSEKTGIKVEMVLSHIPELWEHMEHSFNDDNPPFDVVGCDDLLLLQYARRGLVEPLDEYAAADSYVLGDFEPAALEAVSQNGRLYGIPFCDVSSVLIYRRDLFEKYGIPVPQTMEELTQAALEVQRAVRADGTSDFYGITLRGAPSCGLNFWIMGSNWAPSWGVQWYDANNNPTLDTPEHLAALEHYADLLLRAGPPESPTMAFDDCMAAYRDGRVAMVIEPANEASIVYERGGAVADGTMTTLIPAGPLGTRHAGLYTPPYAIPARSKDKTAAWEVLKFLCAPEQVLDDALKCGFVEVARQSVLNDRRFEARFRPDLVETTRASRPYARGERPVNRHSFQFGDILGEEYVRVLKGEQTPREAIRQAQQRIVTLGSPE